MKSIATRFVRLPYLLTGLFLVLSANLAAAQNIDLSTVPHRDSVQLTIYNSEDLTLVRETRTLSFKPGVNPLQFSWANTLIDPSSVEVKFLTHADQLEVLDTTFPHDKPQMLYWNVQSEIDGEATVEITYFTSGITWTADYLGIANADETAMNFEGFVRVFNNSGEQYENAQIRLVVGTINLVEKIAQLAGVPLEQAQEMDRAKFDDLKKDAARAYFELGRVGGMGAADAPKEIIKQGLSEYFIYTIEGTETIDNGWSKRMRSIEGQSVPFKIQYRYRPEEYGDQLVRMYLLTNNEESKLGTTPLPDGMVRIFRSNDQGGLSYLTAQQIKYVPIGDKIELNLGVDPEVVFELVKLRTWRDNLWLHIEGTDTFRQVQSGKLEIDERATVAGWDDHTLYSQRVRNYRKQPIDLEIRRSLDGHVVFRSALNPTLHDYRTVQYTAQAPAGKQLDLLYEAVVKQGRNATQNNITLEQAGLEP